MILYVIGGIGDVFFSICWLLLIFLQSWLVEKHNVFPCFDSTIFIPTDMVSLCFPGRTVWKTWFLWQDVGGKWKKHWTLQGRNLTERFHGVPSANSAGRLDWCWLGWATRQESGKWRAFKLFKKHVWFVCFLFFLILFVLCFTFSHVFCFFNNFHLVPPSWRQQRWHKSWRTLLWLQGRQIWLLCKPWQCILAACQNWNETGSIILLERWFDTDGPLFLLCFVWSV